MKVFYIETIRIMTVFEKLNYQRNADRKNIIYSWIKGLISIDYRDLKWNKEIATTNDYFTKGFVGEYDGEFNGKVKLCNY